ncbi:MAG TPA: 30S ribosomal protein S12 methylthiotransferase RimO [Bacteroidales bacterium]|nr:30S ribosomal protein S12 methylthiotransferase RimO [Bacteroidales bacterium]HPK29568.1 30S ribosomal protein S12 methylthiotransferase RimO [Bacteroidales bacterium]
MKKLQFISLGCSKNRVDSEHLMKQLSASGYTLVSESVDLVVEPVDCVVINTCGFIQDAKEESIETIFKVVDAKNNGLANKVFVFGCLSQRYMETLAEMIPEVDGFFGVFDFETLLSALGVKYNSGLLQQRILTTPSHYAYLKISEGCDRSCSYCAIPMIRGPHISIPEEEVLIEARNLAQMGVKELIVIAQDTTYYGLDLYRKRALATLLEKLSLIEGIEWIRLHYSYPAGFPEDVLRLIAENPKICKYIDIPLQHSSDKVLKMMRRSIDGRQTRSLIEKMRQMVPGVVLRTTMLVGHPGEGKREFEDLLEFVSEIRFERLGAFIYSEEEGTFGAQNYKDSVSRKVKQERYERLMELQAGISLEYNRSRIGSKEKVILDSFSDGVYVGRSMSESPEVDGEILIGASSVDKLFKGKNPVGRFVTVDILNADEYDLVAVCSV